MKKEKIEHLELKKFFLKKEKKKRMEEEMRPLEAVIRKENRLVGEKGKNLDR